MATPPEPDYKAQLAKAVAAGPSGGSPMGSAPPGSSYLQPVGSQPQQAPEPSGETRRGSVQSSYTSPPLYSSDPTPPHPMFNAVHKQIGLKSPRRSKGSKKH